MPLRIAFDLDGVHEDHVRGRRPLRMDVSGEQPHRQDEAPTRRCSPEVLSAHISLFSTAQYRDEVQDPLGGPLHVKTSRHLGDALVPYGGQREVGWLPPTGAPALGTQRFWQAVTRIRIGHATDKKRYSPKMTGS